MSTGRVIESIMDGVESIHRGSKEMKTLKDLLCTSMPDSSVNQLIQSELERKAQEADGELRK